MGQGKHGRLDYYARGEVDGDVDFLREALRVMVEGIMEAEVPFKDRCWVWRKQF